MDSKISVCSFTGHRIIEFAHQKQLPLLLRRAIEYAYKRGAREFISGGALGFDTLAAREVVLFRMSHPDVRLILLIPCKNQDEKWSDEQKDAYSFLVGVADEAVYVSDEYTPDCMKKRNAEIASRADILIAYVSRSNSGAAQTFRMAKALGKEVYNIYPTLDKV